MQDSQNIKNLILDFGGVIYDISHQKQQDAFEALGYKGFNKVYSQARQNPLFADLECGRISDKDFRAAAKTFLGLDIADQQLDKLWNSILIGFVPERIELLKHLQKNYRLFLLSNTNSIHFQVYMREFKERFGYDFESLFEKAFWSFQIGMRKPDAEIFNMVLKSCDLKAEESLFVDDTGANIEASTAVGMSAHLLAAPQELSDLFDHSYQLL